MNFLLDTDICSAHMRRPTKWSISHLTVWFGSLALVAGLSEAGG